MDKNESVKTRDHWIKVGMDVVHRENPHITMVVDKIPKKSKEIYVEGRRVKKQFIIGVKCHWMDSDGKYWTGMFHTRELVSKDEAERVLAEQSEPDATEEDTILRPVEEEGLSGAGGGSVDTRLEEELEG